MKLIIGLGNPGKEYTGTRHNVGFAIVDYIVNQEKLTSTNNKKMQAEIAKLNNSVILAKPQTFMNNSGEAVAALINFYKLNPAQDLVVIHDDKDILLGEVKIQKNRGDAGHNGIKSIIEKLGTRDFTRVRVGVARAESQTMGDTADFVLGKFNKEEKNILKNVIIKATQEVLGIISS